MLRDQDYFEMRARQERAAAETASDERLRRIHFEFASRYEEILRAYGVDKARTA